MTALHQPPPTVSYLSPDDEHRGAIVSWDGDAYLITALETRRHVLAHTSSPHAAVAFIAAHLLTYATDGADDPAGTGWAATVNRGRLMLTDVDGEASRLADAFPATIPTRVTP